MTLTLGSGPLSSNGAGSLNFDMADAPKHRLLFDDYPRRMRAFLDGQPLLDTTRGKLLHESNILPVFYLPIEDLDKNLLEESGHTTHCPFKGDASYWSLHVGDQLIENAVWHYPQPLAPASWLDGFCSLYDSAPDLWLQEDEPVHGHLRDPYHRVDVLESSRRVVVKAGGETIAESDRPKLLFETGLPPRPYIPRADVRPGILVPSETTSHCPYKGHATYFGVTAGGTLVEDAAWTYESPLPEAIRATDHLSFDGEGIEVEIS